jgi:hypothetical protein
MHALWRRAVRDQARISGIHVRQAAAGQAGRWIVDGLARCRRT